MECNVYLSKAVLFVSPYTHVAQARRCCVASCFAIGPVLDKPSKPQGCWKLSALSWILHATRVLPSHPRNDPRSKRKTSNAMRLHQKNQIFDKSQIHQEKPSNAMVWHQKYQNQFRIPSTKLSIAMRWQQSSKCTRHQPTRLDETNKPCLLATKQLMS